MFHVAHHGNTPYIQCREVLTTMCLWPTDYPNADPMSPLPCGLYAGSDKAEMHHPDYSSPLPNRMALSAVS